MILSTSPHQETQADIALRTFFAGRRVLVAGADGFLGQNCVRALASMGAEISIISRRLHSPIESFANHVHRGNMVDTALITEAVQDQSVVIDCAGASGAVQSNREAYHNLEIECRPHLNLFEACAAQTTPPVVVFFSSRLVYGPPRHLPVDEDHPLNPQSIYAVHKITLENYLRVFGVTRGLPWTVLRLSNPYGPHPIDRERGYGVINQFIHRALTNQPITLYGKGSQKRDYIHVDDVIYTTLTCAAEHRCHNEIFNLGGSRTISLHEALDIIAHSLGHSLDIRQIPWPEEAARIETGDYLTIESLLRKS